MTPIEIQLNWDVNPSAVEYHVYKRDPNAGWVLIATITGTPPTTSYIFNGYEGVQYLFAVRVWNGSYEGELAEINYPTNVSATWTTPSNTPNGLPMLVPYDIQYVTRDEFLLSPIAKGLGYTNQSADYLDGTIDHALLKASSWVNRYCRRYFQKMTIDEMYPNITIQVSNPRMTVVPLQNRPYTSVNSITIQVLKWFIPFELTYLIQFPAQGYYQIVPMLSTAGSTGTPIPSVLLEQQSLGIIWTNYTCGYDIIPEDIKNAVEMIAGQTLAMQRQNPMGASELRTGTFMMKFSSNTDNPILAEVREMLNRWRLHTLLMT